MTRFKDIYQAHTAKYTCKFPHYLDIYDKWFSPFVGTDVTVLEVGSGVGGFLQILKKYFGPKAKIYGIEKRTEFIINEEQIKVFYGDQKDRDFLKQTAEKIGNIDIIIDDAEHTYPAQTATFEELLPYLNVNHGLYACEDLNISYHPSYVNPSYIDYLKQHIDHINTNNSPDIYNAIHFYTYLAILEKSLEPLKYSSPAGVGTGEGV
jgi:23S rRNA U2552 (ribose-2'-O)-methylase RlmE/FtsJ